MKYRPITRRTLIRPAAAVIVGLLSLSIMSCDAGRGKRAIGRVPRIVLVTFDTLHTEMTGPYNPAVETTPVLDRFAESGLLFEDAYTRVPITLPSHTTILSGLTPTKTGVMVNGDYVQDEIETLPEILQAYGYRTAAFLSLGVLKTPFNLSQGFDAYDDEFGPESAGRYRTADAVVDSATEWLTTHSEDPFFLWLHLSDPHEPYIVKDAPPDTQLSLDDQVVGEWNLTSKRRFTTRVEVPPGRHQIRWSSIRTPRADDSFKTTMILNLVDIEQLEPMLLDDPGDLSGEISLRDPFELEIENSGAESKTLELVFDGRINSAPASEVVENYRGEVAFADQQLGRFEDHLNDLHLGEDTLWILLSDHGEGLFRHGVRGHATFGQEDHLRIIWIMRGPGLPSGRRIENQQVLSEDVTPTLLDLLNLPAPDDIQGRSQLSCLTDEGCFQREEWWAYGASDERDKISAVAGYRWPIKVLFQGRSYGIYHLESDPNEDNNLIRYLKQHPDKTTQEIVALQRKFESQRNELQKSLNTRNRGELNPEQMEILKALGYLGD